jgi:hypothetical protein
MCVRVCLCVCMGACTRMCFCVCVRASWPVFLRVRARLCMCARLRACVCVLQLVWRCVCGLCECLRARAFVCARGTCCACAVPSASIFAHVCACVCVCVRVGRTTVCVRLGGAVARRGPAVLMTRPAAPGGGARVRGCGSVRPAGECARSAAGITWTSRTAKAGWAARYSHTSVIDAASGAIYVIGGLGATYLQDVWVSTDGGAQPDSVGGVVGGTLGGYAGGIRG